MICLSSGFGSHQSFWSHLETSPVIWSHLESSGATQSYLDLSEGSGAIWNHLKPSRLICSALELSGAISISGTIWRHLGALGAISRHIEPAGVFWSHLKLSWPIREFHRGVSPYIIMCFYAVSFDSAGFYSLFDDFGVEFIWFVLSSFELTRSDVFWVDPKLVWFDSIRFSWCFFAC